MQLESAENAATTGGVAVKQTPEQAISKIYVLREYVSMSLHKTIDPLLKKLFDKLLAVIWRLLDPAVASIKGSIVGAVGSIPFVGGVLATCAGALIDKVYAAAKGAVSKAIGKLQALLQNKIVGAMVLACFKTGKFLSGGAVQAGTAASNAVAQTSTAVYKKAAADSNSAVKQADADVLKEAQIDSKSVEQTEEKDKADDQAQNAADDSEDDKDEAEDENDDEAEEMEEDQDEADDNEDDEKEERDERAEEVGED